MSLGLKFDAADGVKLKGSPFLRPRFSEEMGMEASWESASTAEEFG